MSSDNLSYFGGCDSSKGLFTKTSIVAEVVVSDSWFFFFNVLFGLFYKHWAHKNSPLSFSGWGINKNTKPYQLTPPREWVYTNFNFLKRALKMFHFYTFAQFAFPKHVSWDWHKKKFKNQHSFLENLRKPLNPYQLTPFYGI